MTNPGRRPAITPNPRIHTEPPAKLGSIQRYNGDQLGIIFKFVADTILANVALAFGGIEILGIKPFDFLTTWGNDVRLKAAQAFNQSMANAAVTASNSASQAIALGEVQVTRGTLQSTVNGLWEANNNTTLGSGVNKTPAELKASQVTVRATGETNKGNIESTWNGLWEANTSQTATSNKSIADVKAAQSVVKTDATNGATGAVANTSNIQATWNSVYVASGGFLPVGGNKSLADAQAQLSGVTTDASNGAQNSQSTIDSIYNDIYPNAPLSNVPRANLPGALGDRRAEIDEQFKSGSNIMLSPDFEVTNIPRFKIGSSGDYSNGTTEPKRSGSRSWRWTQAAGSGGGLYLAPTRSSQRITVRAPATPTTGDWFYVEAWLYRATSGSSGSVRFGPQWFNTTENNQVTAYQTTTINNTTFPVNTWTKLSGYFQVPDNRNAVEFRLETVSGTTTNSVWYVDDVVVREVTDAKEAQNAAGTAQSAAETAQQAAEDAVVYIDDTQTAGSNIVVSPDFEKQTIGRIPVGTPNPTLTGYTTDQKKSGSLSYRWQQPSAASAGIYLQPTPTTALLKVTPGDRFEIEVQAYSTHSTASTGKLRLGVEWMLNGAAITNPATGTSPYEDYREWTQATTATSTNFNRLSWQNLTYTTPACPSNANSARFFIYAGSTTPANTQFFIDDAVVREITRAQENADAAVEGATGKTPPGGAKPDDVKAAAGGQSTTISDINTKVNDLLTAAEQNALAGQSFYRDFAVYSSLTAAGFELRVGALPSGNANGTIVVGAGRAKWQGVGLDQSRGFCIQTSALHTSDYQRVGAVFTTALPYLTSNRGGNLLIARASHEAYTTGVLPNSCVYAKFFYPDLIAGLGQSAKVQLWYRSGGGVETQASSTSAVLAESSFTYTPGATYWLEAGQRGGSSNTFTVYKDSTPILGPLTASVTLPVGTNNRRCGFGMEPGSDALFRYDPAQLGSWMAYDNVPASILGSGFRASNSESTTTPVNTSSGTPVTLGSNYAFLLEEKSSDITYGLTQQATSSPIIGVSGWYAVSVGLQFSTSVAGTAAAIFVNGVCEVIGTATTTDRCSVSAIMYLNSGETVSPGYRHSSGTRALVAGGSRFDNYFSLAFLNNVKPVQP